jgi:basic membrane protein A
VLIIVAACVVAFAAVAAGCGGDDEATAPAPAEEAPAPAPAPAEEGTAAEPPEEFRIAIVTVGTSNNRSWGNAWWEGAVQASEEFGFEVEFVGNQDTPDQYRQQGAAMAEAGFDVVCLCVGYVPEVAVELADQYPDVLFVHYGFAEEGMPPNTLWLMTRQAEVSFLAGALAGLTTQTSKLGAVSGFAFPLLTRQPEGFHLGARCVNPDVEFEQQYIDTWSDAAIARAATEAQIKNGADIIFGAGEQYIVGMYEAAREVPGTYIISSYFDAYDQAPDVILTSVVYGFIPIFKDALKKAYDGELEPHEQVLYGLTDGSGNLASFHEHEAFVGPENLQKLDEITQKVINGEIQIPQVDVLGEIGSGGEVDLASIGCEGA